MREDRYRISHVGDLIKIMPMMKNKAPRIEIYKQQFQNTCSV